MIRWISVLTAGLCLIAQPVLADETRQAIAADSVIETISERGVLKVGLSEFVPWAMRNKNGDLIGFEPDVARELASDMGVELELYPTAWDGIIPALLSGKFDVIIAGMSVTPLRNLKVNFSDPYARSGMGMLANQELAGGFDSLDAFNRANVTFAARRGATAVEVVRARFPDAELLLFDDEPTIVQEVLSGNAHAMVASEPLPSWEVAKNPDRLFKPTDTLFRVAVEAFALRKGDPDALNFFNNWIAGKQRSGWLNERHDYWFASRVWEGQIAR